MTTAYPKRLIEVDLPIKRISAHARREKSIRHGHISTLHIWWARRPLAACRAVVCASLWPDPADDICPTRFIETAKRLMRYWGERYLQKCSADSYPRFNKIARTPDCLDYAEELRKALLDFIADFANWDNSTSAEYLAVTRTLTVAAHDALEYINAFALPEIISIESLNNAIKGSPRPLLVDPFAGGGAIPLEGLRCGADAFASDLNPVAVLLNKVVLEYIPKYGQCLADEVEKWGKWIKEQAEKELAEFYPKDEDGATPIAYLWARTITCEGPGCGAEVPLIRTNNLLVKGKRRQCLQPLIDSEKKKIRFEINSTATTFGTIKSGVVTCPICGYTTANKQVMSQIKAKRGGADSALLIAVVSESPRSGRQYRIAGADHCPHERIVSRLKNLSTSGITAPTDKVNPNRPSPNARGLSAVTRYGMAEFQDIYSPRQALALLTIRNLVSEATTKVEPELRLALGTCLSLAFGRLVDRNSTLCRWIPQTGAVGYTFGRQALSMIWDYAEINPLKHSGGWTGAYEGISETIGNLLCLSSPGQAEQFSATEHGFADDMVAALITDPPYYDAIPYADLSDFFYVWLRPLLRELFSKLARTDTTPKEQEAIWNPSRILQDGRPKDRDFYEKQMRKALSEGRRLTAPTGVGVVVFAHKSTAGWEALLNGMTEAGWVVQASWPIDTERESRTNAIGTASLASSVHIVCRPREDVDGNLIERVGDWRDVLSELPGRIAAWLPRLASEGVVGADAIFACLGPALEIFSRYSSVEKASGEVVPLREYLYQVWAEVARQALNMIFEGADASGFEEDARLTAMWLWTLRTDANGNGEDDEKATSLPGYTLEYDAARKIAQGLGCHLENLTHLVEVKGDKAMLLSAELRARYLFGKEDVRATAKRRKKKTGPVQQDLFSLLGVPDEEEAAAERAELERPPAGKTALDQLHQAMLLFTAGRGAALKRFLVDDGIGTNPQFWTLAQALSALYPSHTNEKRWVDGVLARKKGLGF